MQPIEEKIDALKSQLEMLQGRSTENKLAMFQRRSGQGSGSPGYGHRGRGRGHGDGCRVVFHFLGHTAGPARQEQIRRRQGCHG